MVGRKVVRLCLLTSCMANVLLESTVSALTLSASPDERDEKNVRKRDLIQATSQKQMQSTTVLYVGVFAMMFLLTSMMILAEWWQLDGTDSKAKAMATMKQEDDDVVIGVVLDDGVEEVKLDTSTPPLVQEEERVPTTPLFTMDFAMAVENREECLGFLHSGNGKNPFENLQNFMQKANMVSENDVVCMDTLYHNMPKIYDAFDGVRVQDFPNSRREMAWCTYPTCAGGIELEIDVEMLLKPRYPQISEALVWETVGDMFEATAYQLSEDSPQTKGVFISDHHYHALEEYGGLQVLAVTFFDARYQDIDAFPPPGESLTMQHMINSFNSVSVLIENKEFDWNYDHSVRLMLRNNDVYKQHMDKTEGAHDTTYHVIQKYDDVMTRKSAHDNHPFAVTSLFSTCAFPNSDLLFRLQWRALDNGVVFDHNHDFVDDISQDGAGDSPAIFANPMAQMLEMDQSSFWTTVNGLLKDCKNKYTAG